MAMNEREAKLAAICIPKAALAQWAYYVGHCRNSKIAMWNPDRQVFVYLRVKFGSVEDAEINHFEDDNGFDLFFPYREVAIKQLLTGLPTGG